MNDNLHPLNPPLGYRKVLVLVDTRLVASAEGAWHCLDRIARLAVEQGAELTLCDVVEPPPTELAIDPVAQELIAVRRALARERLEAIAEPLRALVPLSVELCEGTTFLAITRLVLERRFDPRPLFLVDLRNRLKRLKQTMEDSRDPFLEITRPSMVEGV